MANKFTDPVANASSVGFISILAGLAQFLGDNRTSLNYLLGILYVISGYGLWKKKLWGLYAFAFITAIAVVQVVFAVSQQNMLSGITVVFTVIQALFLAWLWKAKDRFSK